MAKAGAWAEAKREIRFLRGVRRTLARVRSIAPGSTQLVCDDLEAAVDRFSDRAAVAFEGRELSYAEFDALANRYANWARGIGLLPGQVVALFTPNRLEYVAIWYGLSKVGVITALVNPQLTGAGLIHCLSACGALQVICDAETAAAYAAVGGDLARPPCEWIVGGAGARADRDRDLDESLRTVSALRPPRETVRDGLTARDVVLYIFTSGTTGLPKAAKITHMRAQLYMRAFAAATEARPDDRVFDALPLYHATGGLCAVGAALLNGGLLIVKRKFSVSQFWAEVVRDRATMFVYIGELCRYLVNQPESAAEGEHRLRLVFGNGLRADVWEKALTRFRIPQVLEFYGATEGNVSLFNFDGRIGAVGRVPRYLRRWFNVAVGQVDLDTGEARRDARGRCVACAPGEVGEMLGEIRSSDARANFAGYVDKAASERKVLHDAFVPGDAWFRTGDLMRQDRAGYFYFIDRMGDTYRWRGENVATTEVAERLAATPGVLEVNVYGVAVPGVEGRAGMAAMSVIPSFDVHALAEVARRTLPIQARPLFLRLHDHLETTGTFKYTKTALVAEGFDPSATSDRLFFQEPGGEFVVLTPEVYAKLIEGGYRL